MNFRRQILVTGSSSWGSIDWIAPIVQELKANKENQLTLLIAHDSLKEYCGNNLFIFEFCKDHFDKILTYNEVNLGSFLFFDKLFNVMPRVLAKFIRKIFYKLAKGLNYSPKKKYQFDIIYQTLVYNPYVPTVELIKNNNLKEFYYIIFPPTTDLYLYLKDSEPGWHHQSNYYLCNSETMARNFSHFSHENETQFIYGIPRYNQRWIKNIQNLHKNYHLNYKFFPEKKYILFLTRGPGEYQLPESDYKYLIESTINEVLKDKNTVLLIKPHPREDLSFMKSILSNYHTEQYEFSSVHTLALAPKCSFAISFAVSAMFDVLACKKPVIEYFIFDNSKYTQDWRQLGFVIPANNQKELKEAIKNLEKDFSSYIKNFEKMFDLSEADSIDRIVHLNYNS